MTPPKTWPPSPLPLAWHPTGTGQKPVPERLVTPTCQGGPGRPCGGLWTSPLVTPKHSFWSIHHDQNELGFQLVREGWAVGWPHRDHTAIIDSYEDLQELCRTYPCTTRHLDAEEPVLNELCSMFEPLNHSSMYQPPLDYPALVNAGYDAVYLSVAGFETTRFTDPGTGCWDSPTVLWLTPTFETLHPVFTDAYSRDGLYGALKDFIMSLPEDVLETHDVS